MFADIFWWVTLLGICLYSVSGSNGDTRIGNRCIEDLSRAFTVLLQCSASEWIHVVHEEYGNEDAETCRLKSAGACSKLLASSRNGLIVSCNGKVSCREVMQVQSIDNCNVTDAAAEIKYNCIKGSMNMCSTVATTVNGSVYLHSPGFPGSVGVNSSCVVRITGHKIQVTLIEEWMRSGILNISGDGRHLWTNMNTNEYNRVLSGLSGEIVIVYDNHDKNGLNVWIRVAGSGQMNITIGGGIPDASATPTSTHSQSTSGPSTLDSPTTETTIRVHSTAAGNSGGVVTALSVVCGILVLIIVVLVIYLMVVKPFRKKHDTSSNTGTPSGYGETNVYDGIQPYTSDACDEHNYGQITISEGSFYVNSASGGDPYVNT